MIPNNTAPCKRRDIEEIFIESFAKRSVIEIVMTSVLRVTSATFLAYACLSPNVKLDFPSGSPATMQDWDASLRRNLKAPNMMCSIGLWHTRPQGPILHPTESRFLSSRTYRSLTAIGQT